MNCCICMAIENDLTDQKRETALQYRRIFPTRDFVILATENHPQIRVYEELLGKITVRRIPSNALNNQLSLARNMLTPEFYDMFRSYDYMLFTSLETWPFYDALDWWMDQGYDYIAAPWLSLGGAGTNWVRCLDHPVGGRERASLRRIKPLREFMHRLQLNDFDMMRYDLYEDIAIAGGLPQTQADFLPKLKYYPRAEQARFAWDRPSLTPDDGECDIKTLMAITRGRIPMLMFSPSEEVRKRYCIPDVDPGIIFMFSSAVKPEYDYEGLVESIEPDPEKRLLVFMNYCFPFIKNESCVRLIKKQRRILTMHNNTANAPFGPAGFGNMPMLLEKAGFKGRHDSRTLRWRSYRSLLQGEVTRDGEIVDEEMTRSMRRIGPEVVNAAPTCGYQVYRILRDKYPNTRIVLVNFYGNSGGFELADVHDPKWEQIIFRRDPLVEFAYAKAKP